jgi:multidrug efflux pump subunit AcrB
MNIADFSIKKKVITWLIVVLMVAGGMYGYEKLGRYEDPEFSFKAAKVITHYPGATPLQVEEEVTDKIEKAIQSMSQIKKIQSVSMAGDSIITVEIKDKYRKKALPQIWDELRRKVHDVTPTLPPGTEKPLVYDGYGDVYGLYYAIASKDYSYKELSDVADYLKKHLSFVKGVAKVRIGAKQQETIFVDIATNQLAQLGVPLETIFKTLASQNLVFPSGSVRVGDEYIRIQPTGTLQSAEEIGNLLIQSKDSKVQFRLSDIATITESYQEVPDKIFYYNGIPAIELGISIIDHGNIIEIGKSIENELTNLTRNIPIGIDIVPIYEQPKIVKNSIFQFTRSLGEALVIIMAFLLVSMGMRSGFIIAGMLWITVLGTFFFMYLFGIDLQRVSLGALILALGMLVDDAVVITEGILVQIQKGVPKYQASKAVLTRTMWPLLGATIVAILAFAPIGLSQDTTGEYTVTLFYVIAISLFLSWVLAITVTPLLCTILLKKKPKKKELYDNATYRTYKSFLIKCLNFRWRTIICMVCLLSVSVYGFQYVKQSFFPDAKTPLFYVNLWKHQGSDIRSTRDDMLEIEKYIRSFNEVKSVTTIVGDSAMRFMLTYSVEDPNNSYGQLIVEVYDYHDIDNLMTEIQSYIYLHFPDSETRIERIKIGPPTNNPVEVRFSGPSIKVLRELAEKTKEIMHKNPRAINIKDNWRQKVKVIEPHFSESQARITGITRADVARTLEMSFSGTQMDLFRDADTLIPIITRPPDEDRLNISSLEELSIWSPLLKTSVPITQMVPNLKTTWENTRILHFDQKRTITVSCAPYSVIASELFNELRPKIEALELPIGYEREWGGEYEKSTAAQLALAKVLPLGFILMILTVIILFNSIKRTLIIWLCVPLAIVGVTFGLLVTKVPFGFMALLGFLSLSGMLIKNGIVLIDQLQIKTEQNGFNYDSIISSCLSRLRPVLLTALTTSLGLIPLLFDVFFQSMAVVIMSGLIFATILTLVFVPVLYVVFYGIQPEKLTKGE